MLAPIHPRQAERLAAIRRYDLGDRFHAGTFDEVVELAAQICNCPIALVSIVREKDQRFEASCGVTIDGTPLESSICSHGILQEGLLEISDCRLDMRTRDNPLVTDPEDPLLFYAGAQIVTGEGLPLGSLCVLDRRPRRLSDQARRALTILAGQVMRQLELHEAVRRQREMRREMDHRVKNSLANVSVLTRMAARGASTEEARAALEQVERRIRIMADLHSDLYRRAGPDAPVDLSGYLVRIVSHLAGLAPDGVVLDAEFAPVELTLGEASALGIALNEMVSNACRHGFPSDRAGRIEVRGVIGEDGSYQVTCKDDGVGSSGGEEPAGGAISEKLGMRIVHASVAQLDGTVRRRAVESGHHVEVSFPLPKSDHRCAAASS
jgi:two-component sensor histidine kinase